MGTKKRHVGLWILAVLIVLVALLFVGVRLAVNTRWAKDKVNQILSSAIDGRVDYARLDLSLLKDFPVFRMTLDTVSLTYDHEKFARYDSLGGAHPLLGRGRGQTRDTLASFDRLTAAVNVWKLLGGRFRVREVRLEGLDAFLHVYDTTASNLDIFLPSGKEKDTTKVFSTPMISIGELAVPDLEAVYTDQGRSMYVSAGLGLLSVGGRFRIDPEGGFKFRNVSIRVDSLMARARIPKDSAQVCVDRLSLEEPYKNVFDLGIDLVADAGTGKYGDLNVPVSISGRVGVNSTDDYTKFVVPGLDARVAHVPIHLDGNARLHADSTAVDVSLQMKDCPLDTLLREYAVKFVEVANQVRTDAHMDIEATAKGLLTKNTVPEITASLKVPRSRIAYLPLEVDGSLLLDVEGRMSPRKKIDATVNELEAVIPGLVLKADGSGQDILSGDPALKVAADADFCAEALMRFLPEKLGIAAGGNASLSVLADGRPTDFVALNFDKVSLKADLDADRLTMRMPSDTLAAAMFRPDLSIVLGEAGGNILISADSLVFSKGENLEVKARIMNTDGSLSKVTGRDGGLLPRLSLAHNDAALSLKTGNNWFRVKDVDILANATKRERLSDALRVRMKEHMAGDSLRRAGLPPAGDDDFREKDVKFSLDTALLGYLRKWNPVAQISIGRGMAAMPVLPLRTRIGGFKASFDGDVLDIDSLSARAGTSDISLKGKASGLRGFLRGRGRVAAELNADSRRVNVNELLAAFSAGKDLADSSFSETDDSFVVDSIASEDIAKTKGLPLVVLPGNVSATVNFVADTVNYSEFTVNPVVTRISMRDRTVQMSDTRLFTDLGKVSLSAFYSSRSKEDISAGVDLGVYGVSPDSLLRLIPSMDSLMPVLKSLNGRLNCEVTALTQLDTAMRLVMPSLEGVVRIKGKALTVEDAGDLRKITRLLQFSNPNIGRLDDLTMNAVVHDNKVDVFPFIFGADCYRMALHGMQGLDRTMYYHASVLKSPFLMRFGVNVFGSFDKWGFTIGFPKYNNNNIPDFSPQIDTMQTYIRHMIRDVFEVEGNGPGRASELLVEKEKEIGYESGMELSPATSGDASSEQVAFEYDAMLQEEELQAEVDAVLEDSYRDIETMMNDYENQIYDKRILRKMERLAKKQAKKKK